MVLKCKTKRQQERWERNKEEALQAIQEALEIFQNNPVREWAYPDKVKLTTSRLGSILTDVKYIDDFSG